MSDEVLDEVPLTTLLSWTWVALTIEVDNAFEAAGSTRVRRLFRISLPMWTNGLRCIAQDGTTVDELRRATRSSCSVGGLERWGWITVGEADGTRRAGFGSHRGITGDTVLRPSRAGTWARRQWPTVLADVEQRGRERYGAEVIDGLRTALGPVADRWPWSPPEVRPSDGFLTHVVDGPTEHGDGDGAADGADPDGDEDRRPLVALLGQVLTAATVGHESDSTVSLPLAADVLRIVGPDGVALRELPSRSGLSKEGIAMATGYLERNGLAIVDGDRTLTLTSTGGAALEDYHRRARQADDRTLRSRLAAVLGQRGALVTGLEPPVGCWRGEAPYLARTRRLLADPIGSLPWQPMVLHRGGWPDAS